MSAFNDPLHRPMLGLLIGSAAALGLLTLRVVATGHWRELYLAWNLFLALVPLPCAWILHRDMIRGSFSRLRLLVAAGCWFLFFPNAPYIFTDVIHLLGRDGTRFWVDMVLFSMFALTGLVAGFISLYLMHGVVRRWAGDKAGWVFVVLMGGLGGVAVYIGRFLRWNSWDLVLNPIDVLQDTTGHFMRAWDHPLAFMFPALFSVFIMASYAMMYALTYLPRHTQIVKKDPHAFESGSRNSPSWSPR